MKYINYWPSVLPQILNSLIVALGLGLVSLSQQLKPVQAGPSPQWVTIEQSGEPGSVSTAIINNPMWSPLNSTAKKSGTFQEPIFITQSGRRITSPLEDNAPPTFIPLHRRRGGDAFVPGLLPVDSSDGSTSEDQENKCTSSPGTSIMIPSAYGSKWGAMGIGLGGQERVRFSDKRDATMGLSLALGDPQKNVGLQLGLGLTNLSNILDRGNLSWKLHRQIDPNDHIAIGGTSLFNWGGGDGGSSGYGVYTHRFELKEDPSQALGALTLSVGLGGGQFRKEEDINAGEDYLGLFGGASLKVAEPVNAIAEWTGQDLTLGLSIAPFAQIPLVITPAITDITGTAGDGTRFILGLGYGFSL